MRRKEGDETKALLMQVINDKIKVSYEAQEKRNTEYEEKIKRLEEAISGLTDSQSRNWTLHTSSFSKTSKTYGCI